MTEMCNIVSATNKYVISLQAGLSISVTYLSSTFSASLPFSLHAVCATHIACCHPESCEGVVAQFCSVLTPPPEDARKKLSSASALPPFRPSDLVWAAFDLVRLEQMVGQDAHAPTWSTLSNLPGEDGSPL
ncbi:hypothetical protein CDAR_236811 [Caerostris darwini]|uniref:Uncharacterized protein n=1 Tax=Caerostris darwini TaxID=1538125 RepID=A0AAV4S647_9ARAC|nr:hypothetical protein CDAR_236811 [Caerostris darwini]